MVLLLHFCVRDLTVSDVEDPRRALTFKGKLGGETKTGVTCFQVKEAPAPRRGLAGESVRSLQA